MTSQQYLTMRQAAERLPGKPHVDTVHRRRKRGDLKAVFDGHTWHTTQEWLDEFLSSKTQPVNRTVPAVHPTVNELRRRYARKRQ